MSGSHLRLPFFKQGLFLKLCFFALRVIHDSKRHLTLRLLFVNGIAKPPSRSSCICKSFVAAVPSEDKKAANMRRAHGNSAALPPKQSVNNSSQADNNRDITGSTENLATLSLCLLLFEGLSMR